MLGGRKAAGESSEGMCCLELALFVICCCENVLQYWRKNAYIGGGGYQLSVHVTKLPENNQFRIYHFSLGDLLFYIFLRHAVLPRLI